MNLLQLCQWLNETSLGTSLRESTLMFPLVETAHLLAIALLVGTVAVLDLRLTGVVFRSAPVSSLAAQILPLTWAGFAVTSATGLLLFVAEAERMYSNPAFRWKLLFLLLVGLNPLIFHKTVFRRVADWDTSTAIPLQARIAGISSILLWSGVIVTGRAIAYF